MVKKPFVVFCRTPEIVRPASPPPEVTPVPIKPVVSDDGGIDEPEPVFTEPVAMATAPLPPTDPLTIPFDLCVDAATNIPDNATIAKVRRKLGVARNNAEGLKSLSDQIFLCATFCTTSPFLSVILRCSLRKGVHWWRFD